MSHPGSLPLLFLPRPGFQSLLDVLAARGFSCIGPKFRDGAIVYEEMFHADELPLGFRDRQAPGEYRLEKTGETRCFAWANGPQGIKPHLFAPRESLWRAERREGRLFFRAVAPNRPPVAFIGARSCDLAGLALQDAHFLEQAFFDPYYHQRRADLFLVAMDCSHPASTCFCASTGDGPVASSGYDIALAEIGPGYLARAGSERGQGILDELDLGPASESDAAEAEAQGRRATETQTRGLPGRNLREMLFSRLDHPRWQQVAQRCLSCGNCTSVCPTCFCHKESEHPALDGGRTEHLREWDSCFTEGHSYLHGFVVRQDTRLRYRQWLTHKLGSWHDQYGRSGCVGCGRCVAWCPAGIDITEEALEICGEGDG